MLFRDESEIVIIILISSLESFDDDAAIFLPIRVKTKIRNFIVVLFCSQKTKNEN